MEPMHHCWHIPEREYERHEARRGRRFAYETIDARHTALVVVDMVPFFVEDNPYCRAVIPTINRLAGALRKAGGLVTWVVPAVPSAPSPWSERFYGAEVAGRYRASGGAGDVRGRLAPSLDVGDEDVVTEKAVVSAFFPGSSVVPEVLTERGVDTVLVAGTVTNVCCESTARDASTLGYQVIMIADACASIDDESHNATLRTIYRSFGDVRPAADVEALITRNS